jgi:hypothetical protein
MNEPSRRPSALRLERLQRVRALALVSCAVAPPTALVAFVCGFLDPDGGESLLAGIGLAVGFIAVFFGLAGLFALVFVKEADATKPMPNWAAPAGVIGCLGGMIAGFFSFLT